MRKDANLLHLPSSKKEEPTVAFCLLSQVHAGSIPLAPPSGDGAEACPPDRATVDFLFNPRLFLERPEERERNSAMKFRPAGQEKPTAKTKSRARRAQSSSGRLSRQATAKGTTQKPAKRHAPAVKKEQLSATQPAVPSSSPLVPSPVFVRRDITAPDGSVRPGWEMWIGDHCFGRADSKELLLASFQRLQSPPESFHWREVRNRMQMRGRLRAIQPEEAKEDPWGWGKKNETGLLEEEADGFQELALDTTV
jgi:hypothetical protein